VVLKLYKSPFGLRGNNSFEGNLWDIVLKISKNLKKVSNDDKIYTKGRFLNKAGLPTDNKNKGRGLTAKTNYTAIKVSPEFLTIAPRRKARVNANGVDGERVFSIS
jgi:hypothetical protein